MSDEERSEYKDAWNEDREGQGQPDEGRTGADQDQADLDAAGAGGADAGGPPATHEAPPADADLPPAAGEEDSDEFAGLSPDEMRERLKALSATVATERQARTTAENTLRSNEGRYSRAEREAAELRERMRALPAEEPKQEVPVISDAELSRIESEYDDLGPVFAGTVRALNAQIEELKKDGTKRAELQQAEADRDREVFLGKQRAILEEKHPDWQEVARTDTSYATWARAQPDWVRDLIRRNANALVDGEAATFVFDKFRAETKPAVDPHEQRRERQLEGSTHIPPRTPAFEPRSKAESGSYQSEWEIAKREEQQERDRAARTAARR